MVKFFYSKGSSGAPYFTTFNYGRIKLVGSSRVDNCGHMVTRYGSTEERAACKADHLNRGYHLLHEDETSVTLYISEPIKEGSSRR